MFVFYCVFEGARQCRGRSRNQCKETRE